MCIKVIVQSLVLCSDSTGVSVYVLLGMRCGDGLQGPVQLVQNSTVGQYQVTLHHCAQTAVEQLFLITEQSVWIPTSANLLCVYVHDTFQCVPQRTCTLRCVSSGAREPLCAAFAGEPRVPIFSDVCLCSDSKVGLAQTDRRTESFGCTFSPKAAHILSSCAKPTVN